MPVRLLTTEGKKKYNCLVYYPERGIRKITIPKKRINRFLLRERYEPKGLFEEIKPYINRVGGILSVDDTVADKPYSNPTKAKLIGYFWSGKHHQVFKGINIVTLYYRDPDGKAMPINYRIYDKQEGKTKNNYFREMIEEVIELGIKPLLVTGDTRGSQLGKSKVF